DVEPAPDLPPPGLHLVDPDLRILAGGLGGALELQTVLVGPREVEDLLAGQPVVPGDDVGGDGVVGVPDVRDVVGVVDRRREVEDVPAHGRVILEAGRTGGSRGDLAGDPAH